MRLLLAALAVLFLATAAGAHELRPAYLEIRQTAGDDYAVTWKVPARSEARLALYLRLPEACADLGPIEVERSDSVHAERWSVRCAGGLQGGVIVIEGLAGSLTDVLVRFETLAGDVTDARLTPDRPSLVLAAASSDWEVFATYGVLGFEHILEGFDHLLFVFALLLLVRRPWLVVKTVTAFTLAHSLTLAAAVLGLLSLPPGPVEAAIALSIVFLALEIHRAASRQETLTARRPWIVAFAFGLLHGLGFAGALTEIGLPAEAVPLALLAFNLGVEAGQLAFIAVALLPVALLPWLFADRQRIALVASAYVIGGLASGWLLERLAALG